MFERLAEGWKTGVALATSEYTKALVLLAGGGAIDYIPMLNKFGGAVIAAMGVYVLGKAIVASVKKTS